MSDFSTNKANHEKELRSHEILLKRREQILLQKEQTPKEGILIAGTYTKYETIQVKESASFYLVEKYKKAIPVCITSEDSYQLFTLSLGKEGWELPENTCCLPTIQAPAMQVLLRTSPDWEILPVLTSLLVTKPRELLSPSLIEAIREAKKRARSLSSYSKKVWITGTLDLDNL